MILKNSILEKHLKSIALSLNANIKNKVINFRCNICGDTNVNKSKKSAYIILRPNRKLGYDTWQFYCHRGSCNKSMLAEIWLKHYYPTQYKLYVSDLLSMTNENSDDFEKIYLKQKELEKKKKNEDEIKDVKFFISILENEKICKDAIEICKKRLIKTDIWRNWFVSIDRKYKNRIIIPFYDNNNSVYYWQGRAIYNYMEPKYMNRSNNRDFAIYNYYNINKNKEVLVVEGPIDSTFLNNSIAILGTNISENADKLIKNLNKFYLFDNDKAGYTKSYQYLMNGENVFIWEKFLRNYKINKKIKDINELVINFPEFLGKLNFENLKNYFTNNLFDKIYLV
jgi:5S rRNA maturation endonuclease (ribonuclease M5)